MTWLPRRIVTAVDGSESSIRAAQHAVDLARAHRRPCDIRHRRPSPRRVVGARRLAALTRSPRRGDRLRTAGDPRLGAGRDRHDGHRDLRGRGARRSDHVAIVAVCENENADVLVIGRRGAGLVERMMIGSVADRLAHTAPCPLLVIP